MRKVLFGLGMMLSLGMFSACSSDDETAPILYNLYNQWVLVSYINETDEVLKEAKGYYYEITFKHDGTYFGKAYGNEMWGEYKCSGNEIQISHPYMTKIDMEGADQDDFFQEHLNDVYLYQLSGKELRLYFSEDKYFKFKVKDNES